MASRRRGLRVDDGDGPSFAGRWLPLCSAVLQNPRITLQAVARTAAWPNLEFVTVKAQAPTTCSMNSLAWKDFFRAVNPQQQIEFRGAWGSVIGRLPIVGRIDGGRSMPVAPAVLRHFVVVLLPLER